MNALFSKRPVISTVITVHDVSRCLWPAFSTSESAAQYRTAVAGLLVEALGGKEFTQQCNNTSNCSEGCQFG